jgi:hypothetical protein
MIVDAAIRFALIDITSPKLKWARGPCFVLMNKTSAGSI